jgi:hypothetical protein
MPAAADTTRRAVPQPDPAYATNAMNGEPVVQFNSANSTYLTFARLVQDDTIACVFQSS